MNAPVQHESLWHRWVVKPVVAQLKQGTTPSKIAQAIALGVAAGVFPLLGTTTVLGLALGVWLKLNQPVLQVFLQLVYPVQLATILLFMRAGESLFGAEHVPLSIPMMMERFFADPMQFLAKFGMIGLYGVVVWLLLAPLLIALVYFISRPFVEKLHKHIRFPHHDT